MIPTIERNVLINEVQREVEQTYIFVLSHGMAINPNFALFL